LTLLVVPALVALTGPPAAAQSRWNVTWPAVLGMAEKGLLVTAAPPTFTGCTLGSTAEWLEGMLPNVYLFSFFLVDDPEAPTWSVRWLPTPPGAYNFSWISDARIRVFRLQQGDLEWYQLNPCNFYDNHEYLADGLGRLNMHSPDDLLEGPGANSWGWVLQGHLQDGGYCPAGMNPRLFWLQEWVNRSTDYSGFNTKAVMGPTLTCK
jgi:hypothetical protein